MLDHVVGLHQLMGLPVMEGAALPCDVLLRLGQQDYRFASAVTARLTLRHLALAGVKVGPCLAVARRSDNAPSISEGGKRLQPRAHRRLLPG
jgi:hypothetical protein